MKIKTRKDPQIMDLLIAHGHAGYGLYVMLTQYFAERKALRSRQDIARIAYELHASEEMVRSVLEDFDLFTITDDQFANPAAPKPARKSTPKPAAEPSLPTVPATSPSPLSAPSSPPKVSDRRSTKPYQKIPVKNLLKRRKPHPSKPYPYTKPR